MKLNVKNNINIVGLAIGPDYISLSTVKKENSNYIVEYLEDYKIEDSEIINLYIFSYLKLSALINDFLIKNKLNKANLIICLDGPEVYQNITTDLSENMINYKTQVEKLNTNGNNLFYVAGIKPSLLLQYKLFSINYRFKIIGVTVPTIAWYYAQQAINYNFVPFCESVEIFKNFLKNSVTQKTNITENNFLTALGLYNIGLKVYENY